MKRVFIFDTTLRDGEQSPGVGFTAKEKLEIARQLEKLKVDVIEAGFPASSPGDFEAVKEISQKIKNSVICALARALPLDIEKAGESLKEAKRGRIHIFIATSPIHIKYKLRKTPEEVLNLAVEAVKMAKKFGHEIEFSPEDASRTEPSFLYRILEAVIEEGAGIINIPDTVGYSVPSEFAHLIEGIIKNVSNIEKVILSCHCHNDLGMATANSLSAIKNGVSQVECTINGIGERAGNASLEEVVMALKTRQDFFGFSVNIETTEIYKTSRLVSRLTGFSVQPNKAIVGKNAFRHAAGIHQDGVLKKTATYEIMDPSSVGVEEEELVLGKLSGRHAFKERLKKLGFHLGESELESVFKSFKNLADKKKEIFDEDLIFIVEEQTFQVHQVYSLDYIHTISGNQVISTATVRIKKEGKVFQEAACGDGPVDAVYKAIDRIIGIKVNLVDYSLHAVTEGKDALGEVTIKIQKEKEIVSGRGVSTDIIEASAKAYIDAINRLIHRKKQSK